MVHQLIKTATGGTTSALECVVVGRDRLAHDDTPGNARATASKQWVRAFLRMRLDRSLSRQLECPAA